MHTTLSCVSTYGLPVWTTLSVLFCLKSNFFQLSHFAQMPLPVQGFPRLTQTRKPFSRMCTPGLPELRLCLPGCLMSISTAQALTHLRVPSVRPGAWHAASSPQGTLLHWPEVDRSKTLPPPKTPFPVHLLSLAMTPLLQSLTSEPFLFFSSNSSLIVMGTETLDPTLTGSPSFPLPGGPGSPGAPGSPLGPPGPGLPASPIAPWKEKWTVSRISDMQRVSFSVVNQPEGGWWASW